MNLEKFKHKTFCDGRIIMLNADCETVMAEIGDKEIDLVLTDPPYGISYDFNAEKAANTQNGKSLAMRKSYGLSNWDKKPEKLLLERILEISKNQIIFGAEHLCLMLPQNRGWIVWDKLTGENNFSDCELAWTSLDKPLRKFTFMWNGMLQGNMKEKQIRFHPTQKPIQLMAWCLNNYSKENDLIFDAFAGSFTTAIACIRTKRRFIGAELDPVYFEKAVERVETELRQGVLF